MKKYLLLFSLMAVVQFAFGTTLSQRLTANDSIIIEFGKSGKIVLLIDSKEDFDKLKAMDVNEIIRQLDVELNKETGEWNIVEHKTKIGNREIVTVKEQGPETEVTVGRVKVIVDESDGNTKVKVESTERKKKKEPAFKTDFNIDLGINSYLNADGDFPSSADPFATKGWGSWNVGLNWMASQRISKGFYWDFGLGFQWYNFKFENRDFQAVRGVDEIEFIQRTDVNGFKSKISASYLTAQTLLKLDFGRMNDNGHKGLRIAAGPYIGYRLGGRSKYVYREFDGGGRRKEKLNTGTFLNNYRYGLRGELGVGRLNFFTTYDLNTLFQEGRGPELNPITFGVIF
ncbi:outer membrane beta-barrel protein [Belliella kenyensis]|uniref:Outer membrane beta-barrel protein n=1 Tax=Belliella kenyensis TaxID=1472724 RepID=A0ABV8EN94_9BACT|nr:outer membrane beta-barrel protein [Belliella kenyensis]MCH7403622.1 PorT family protein [Belliella kenyensis]MDN3603826.1 outer membrane beta-barrel protein [Belliella kenyensis]